MYENHTEYDTSASSNLQLANDALHPPNAWSPHPEDASPKWTITLNDNDTEISNVAFVMTNVENVTVIAKLPDGSEVPINVCTQITFVVFIMYVRLML